MPKPRRRRPLGHPGTPPGQTLAPHEGWRAAFKGHFTTGAGLSGSPLAVADGYRRWLLGRHAPSSTPGVEAKPVFRRLLHACGVPQRRRTANGVPWATNPLGRRSPPSAWGVRLGSLPAPIAPGTPQPNGRHERRHRPPNAAPTRPRPPPGAPNDAPALAAAKPAIARARTTPPVGRPRLHALRSRRV